MVADSAAQTKYPDPEALAAAVMNIAQASQENLLSFMREHGLEQDSDPFGLGPAFSELFASWMSDPAKLLDAQFLAWQNTMAIWQQSAQRMMGIPSASVVEPRAGDRRFKDPDWENNPFFDFLKQSYLVAANTILTSVKDADGLDAKKAQKLEFFTKQFIDAVSPTNFAATNPEVLRTTVESGGRNLLDGFAQFLADIDPKDGSLHTKMTDTQAFELGRNIAATPGKVVFETELMQLIQFEPTTAEVSKTPLLIVPPWINKYYVLDMQEKNSFIKWAVAQGHTVFIISWVNPDESLAEKDFEDYVFAGPMAALDAIELATGERNINIIGYCLGGTLVGAVLAYLCQNNDRRVRSATFFTSLLDFSDPGDLGVFIDEDQVASLEQTMNARGYLDGGEMSTTFNMLRANDLIWSFVINNYLLGKEPVPFDLLYWNGDSTRMPAKMHSTYLRKMYMENAFREPGGITIGETPIDLSQVDIPACFVSAAEDHIAPWKTTYRGAQIFAGEVDFILSKSGHIAGIVNPPGPRQYGHFIGPNPKSLSADEWFEQAQAVDESWWSRWETWLQRYSDGKVAARIPGDGKLEVIEPAPGRYAKLRIV